MIIDMQTKPGLYRTTKAHRLVKPDRRLRGGWLSTEGVEAGTRILVQRRADWRANEPGVPATCDEIELHMPSTHGGGLKDRVSFWVYYADGRVVAPYHSSESSDMQRLVLDVVADLEPTREGTSILHWVEPGFDAGDAVLALLLHAGRVSEADVRKALDVREGRFEREHRIECFVAGWDAYASPTKYRSEPVHAGNVGEYVRGMKGGREESCVAAGAGWLAANHAAAHGPLNALSDAQVAEQAGAWVDTVLPSPDFGLPSGDAGKIATLELELERTRAHRDELLARIATATSALAGPS